MKILKEEANVLERAKNRYIIQFYCIDEYEGSPVMITDFADMGSLSKVLENNKIQLDWDTRWRFAEDIASGINFLHNMDVVHRDLKSDNVLLTKTMEIKLCDFGLARVKENFTSKSMFSTTYATGTLPWMAPELFGLNPKFGRKSDIYAYGMILWEIASRNTKPFKSYHQFAISAITQNGIREEIPNETPTAFRNIIEKCWGTIPSDRPFAVDVVKMIQELDNTKKCHIDCLNNLNDDDLKDRTIFRGEKLSV